MGRDTSSFRSVVFAAACGLRSRRRGENPRDPLLTRPFASPTASLRDGPRTLRESKGLRPLEPCSSPVRDFEILRAPRLGFPLSRARRSTDSNLIASMLWEQRGFQSRGGGLETYSARHLNRRGVTSKSRRRPRIGRRPSPSEHSSATHGRTPGCAPMREARCAHTCGLAPCGQGRSPEEQPAGRPRAKRRASRARGGSGDRGTRRERRPEAVANTTRKRNRTGSGLGC